jgi:hypothetical protein
VPAPKPILVDEKNVHWHSLRQVQEYAAQMKALAAPADSVDGAIAAAAFELLDGGADAADLVKSLKLSPSEARRLQSEWADLRGGFVLTGRGLGKIARLRTSDGTLIRTEDDLVRFLRQLVSHRCATCPRSPVFCMICFNNRPPRAEELVALGRQRSRESRARAEQGRVEQEDVLQARARSEHREPPHARGRGDGRGEPLESAPSARTTPESAKGQADAPAQEGHEDSPQDRARRA